MCLAVEKAGLLIARPLEARDYDHAICVLPTKLPGQQNEFHRGDLRFFLEDGEFKSESYNYDKDHKRADQILEKLGFAFLRSGLAHSKSFSGQLEDLTHLAIDDFVNGSVTTEYQLDEAKLERMFINGVQEAFDTEKRMAISSVNQRVGPRGFLTSTRKQQ